LAGNKCFLLGGTVSNAQVNWTQARSACQHYGQGYDLASINSMHDQGKSHIVCESFMMNKSGTRCCKHIQCQA